MRCINEFAFFGFLRRISSPSFAFFGAFGHMIAFCATLISPLFYFIRLYRRWSRSTCASCVFFGQSRDFNFPVVNHLETLRGGKAENAKQTRKQGKIQFCRPHCAPGLWKTSEYFGSKWGEMGECQKWENAGKTKNAGKWGKHLGKDGSQNFTAPW